MGATRKNGGHQQGAQQHGEGQHGRKTSSKLAEQWNHPEQGVGPNAGASVGASAGSTADRRSERATGPRYDEEEIRSHSPPGRHRMFEGREQHDEADLNSEKTRLVRDAERHGHIGDGELNERSARSTSKRKS